MKTKNKQIGSNVRVEIRTQSQYATWFRINKIAFTLVGLECLNKRSGSAPKVYSKDSTLPQKLQLSLCLAPISHNSHLRANKIN